MVEGRRKRGGMLRRLKPAFSKHSTDLDLCQLEFDQAQSGVAKVQEDLERARATVLATEEDLEDAQEHATVRA